GFGITSEPCLSARPGPQPRPPRRGGAPTPPGAVSDRQRHESLPHLLLARDGLLRALAGAGVGVGALAVHRQPAAVADALVAADLDLALDVLGDVATQVALDLQVRVDVVAEPRDLFVGQVTYPRGHVDPRALADLPRPGPPDAEDVGEGDLQPLLAGDVDARDTSQCALLALPLLVTGVGADHHHATSPADDLALLTDPLDAGTNLHGGYLYRYVMR